MEYNVLLTKQPAEMWRGVVLSLPGCTAEAATPEEVLARIKDNIANTLSHSYLVKLEVPGELPQSNGVETLPNGKTFEEEWPDFGIFRDDPTWGEISADIERRRDATRIED